MVSIFQELIRRKVFRVASVYAVVAWLVIQIADVVLPTFNAPQGFNQALVILLVLGFPVALVLAWAFEITPDRNGNRTEGNSSNSSSDSPLTTNSIIIPLMVMAVGFLFIDRYILSGPDALPDPLPESEEAVTRSSLVLGYFHGMLSANRTFADISADGKLMAYIVRTDEGHSLYVRDLSSNESTLVLTESIGMGDPVFSDDGKNLLVNIGSQIIAISLETGRRYFESARILSGFGRGKDWLSNNSVVYSSSNGSLHILSLIDGSVESANIPREENELQAWPQVIDDNRIVYTATGSENFNQASVVLYDYASDETTTLIENGFNASVLASDHIVFMRENDLFARSIDPQTLVPNGPELEVVSGISSRSRNWGEANYAVSKTGRLIYLRGIDGNELGRSYVLRDLEGNESKVNIPNMRWGRLRLSPDGSKILLVGSGQVSSSDVYIYYVETGVMERRTYTGVDTAIWAPDSNGFIYAENTGEGSRLMHMSVAGLEQADMLLSTTSRMEPFDASEDGSVILLTAGLAGSEDVYALNLNQETRELIPMITSPENNTNVSLSPDGNWLAYNRDGRINIHPYPDVSENNRREITTSESQEPRWGNSSNELYFHDQGKLQRIQLNTENGLTWSQPETVFDDIEIQGRQFVYDLSSDGQTFLLPLAANNLEENLVPLLTILEMVDDWFVELRELARAGYAY